MQGGLVQMKLSVWYRAWRQQSWRGWVRWAEESSPLASQERARESMAKVMMVVAMVSELLLLSLNAMAKVMLSMLVALLLLVVALVLVALMMLVMLLELLLLLVLLSMLALKV